MVSLVIALFIAMVVVWVQQKQHSRVIQEYTLLYEILHMYNNASAVYNYFRFISYFRFLRTKQVEKAKSE